MKVLSIGNSFSTDAHRYLHQLAKINGIEMETVNLFIGGCDLETHWNNLIENNVCYDLEINGNDSTDVVSIIDTINSDTWDIITLQQASALSGIYESTQPYLNNLVEFIRQKQPNVSLYYHETWAYDVDSPHSGFLNYDNNQHKMYSCIKATANAAAEMISAKIIPTGDVIQQLRSKNAFNYPNGGLSLCRDSFHLSEDYGRFAAAATWLHTLSGKKVKCTGFNEMEISLINIILDTINNI